MNMPRWAAGLFAAALMISPCRAQTDGSDPRSGMGTHDGQRNFQAEANAAAAMMERMTPRASQARPVAPPNTPAIMRRAPETPVPAPPPPVPPVAGPDTVAIETTVAPAARGYVQPPPRGRIYLYSSPLGAPVRR